MNRRHHTAADLRRMYVLGFEDGQTAAREQMQQRLAAADYEQAAIADYVTGSLAELNASATVEDLG